MSRHSPQLLLDDILSSIAKIARYCASFDREQFLDDEKTIDAVVRNLEIIGEATRQLPEAFTTRHAQVPWAQMAGLRNRIVHEYFGLDLDIIWAIVRDDLLILSFALFENRTLRRCLLVQGNPVFKATAV